MPLKSNHDACGQPGLMPVDDAITQICSTIKPVSTETLNLQQAKGYVLAESITANINVPPADNSSMDGYAIRVEDLENTPIPLSQRIAAGDQPKALTPGTCARIFTGAEIPAGANAVVMQEKTSVEGEKVSFPAHIAKGENIRQAGQDIQKGHILLEAGTRLNAISLGLIASIGQEKVTVYRKPRVTLLSTGNELVDPGLPLQAGQIYNSNRYLLLSLFESLGCEVIDGGIIPDTLTATKEAMANAAKGSDFVVTSGGVSVGEEDHVKPAVEQLGKLNLWRMAMKPGKPLAFGSIHSQEDNNPDKETYFVGLPGNPVSAFLTALIIVRPALAILQGRCNSSTLDYQYAEAAFSVKTGLRREYLRVRSKTELATNNIIQMELFPNQNSGVLTSCQWAESLAVIEPEQQVQPGDRVKCLSLSSLMQAP